MKHKQYSEKLEQVLAQGLKDQNEWTRLQTALVLDDFKKPLEAMEKEAKALIKNDYNKYVARVLNRALNKRYGTSNKVR